MKVLFVDDERSILDGLRRMLSRDKKDFEIGFAEGGPAALEAMEKDAYDVVISDMRMPGMDGVELLTAISKRWPSAARVILSGQADSSQTQRAAVIAHQYLAKPCDPAALRAALRAIAQVRELLGDETMRELMSSVDPPLVVPAVWMQLNDALAEPDVEIKAVAKIVESDPMISLRVLQLTNSSFFGIARQVTSVTQATTFIGLRTLRDLVLVAGMFKSDETMTSKLKEVVARVQDRSMRTAALCRAFAGTKYLQDSGFTTGLLHDIGALALARMPEATLETAAGRVELTAPRVGAYLLGLWGLPASIVRSVAFRTNPAAAQDDALGELQILHVASAMVNGHLEGTPWRELCDADYLGRTTPPAELARWEKLAEEKLTA